MQRAGSAREASAIPARLLAIVLCTAAASGAVQMLQRPQRAAAGVPPTSTATQTETGTATETATETATSTATETATNTATETATNTATETATSTPTSTATSTATDSPGPSTNTPTATETATATPTTTATATITPTAEVGTALCSDGIDNNLNGLIDCADPSCAGSEPCVAGAPALSPVLSLLALAGLSLIALLQLRRRLR